VQDGIGLSFKSFIMRIIRIVVILLVALVIFIPTVTLASNDLNDEVNVKNDSVMFIKNLFIPESVFAKEPVENSIEKSVKNSVVVDERLDQILFKWKEKQLDKWNKIQAKDIIINASAYTASADECGNSKGITASGVTVQENRTIACSQEFPFGAKIEIEGMGTYVCEDRGGAIKGNHVDIYMQTKKEAFAFGRKNMNARIVLE
jgi:3D (Asp-Asp-Asp) domain-containing protein